MAQNEPLIQHVSDTARWVAVFRARESERPDALFRDPFARRLAGERGEQIAASIPFGNRHMWPYSARTHLFDQFITEQIQQGTDMVVNLAAGLDARPYRMPLAPSLRWVEIDFPEILQYKEEILAQERPACALERIRLNLADAGARREVFERLGSEARKALILCEGLLIYLTEEEVGLLAQDLAAVPTFQNWLIDLASPALLRMLRRKIGGPLVQTPMKFAPAEGPEFFPRYGWKAADVRSSILTAYQLKRLPWWMNLMVAVMPASPGFRASRPWSGICRLERQ
jgi:methyltransferase (TIGR00027 family)